MPMQYHIERSTRPAITSLGRGSRRGAYQCLVTLPSETKGKLDAMIEGGSISSAIAGLITFALDTLEKENSRLVIKNDG